MKKVLITRHRLFQKHFGVFPVVSKFSKNIFLGALPNLPPTTPATTLEIWRNVNYLCGFAISMFFANNCRFGDQFSLRQFSSREKLGGPILESSMPLEILGNIGALHSVPQTTILGKRQFPCGFADFSSLGQKLPFRDKSYHFRDINCRFKDKSPFQRRYFRKGNFRRFFIVGAKIAVFRTLIAVWGIKCRFRDEFLLGQFPAIFSSFYGKIWLP